MVNKFVLGVLVVVSIAMFMWCSMGDSESISVDGSVNSSVSISVNGSVYSSLNGSVCGSVYSSLNGSVWQCV